jgi:prepilin-type N-terminal cleavage/methylation domain-containing protein
MNTSTIEKQMKKKGFTLIEMITAITILGIMLSIAIPRLRVSPSRRVESEAYRLLQNLELSRTRAMAARSLVRVSFDVGAGSYTGYLDEDRNGQIDETLAERQALRAGGLVELGPDVNFGRGGAPSVPGDTASGQVTFSNNRVVFDGKGITVPFGARGTIYFVHRDHPDAVAAVAVTSSASFRLWTFKDGRWQ